MLSISARGSASKAVEYYEHLSADSAPEDYYAQEAPGRYLGRGAEQLGLSEKVQRDEFTNLAEGRTPAGEAQNAGEEDRRAGWDLTFSAPKSVSILWALADEETRAAIETAHDEAVKKSVGFLEDHAAFTRRGSGANTDEERRERVGLIAAAYRHGTSREQDPQLHTHVFVFNCAPRADGSVGALDARPLYQWRMAAGAAYQAELAQKMRQLGYEVEADGRSFRVARVPNELETEFSKRRQQIEAALAERGASGGKAAEIAALDTRKTKEILNQQDLLQNWRTRALERAPEWTPEQARETRQPETRHAISTAELLTQLTRDKSTFSHADLYAAVAVAQQSAGGDIAEVERAVAALKLQPELVALDVRGEPRFTTQEMLALESGMVDRAGRLARAQDRTVQAHYVQQAIASRPEITAEQKRMVEHVTGGERLACVQGMAGTGKSFSLGCARQAWEGAGYRVRGAALSGKAAAELQTGSGIRSLTLARLELDTGSGDPKAARDPLTARDVLVLDEAGMVDSRQMARLLDEAEKAGTKVVLVGDTLQLQAIEAGAAFRAIQERVGFVELGDIRRQRSIQDREAVRALRDGRSEEALKSLSVRDQVHGYATGREAKQEAGRAVVTDMAAGKSTIALTATRAEARDVNQWARMAARDLGLVTGEDVAINARAGERQFAPGDRVLFTRNNRELDLKNGDLGTVQALRAEDGRIHLVAVLDKGGTRIIDTARYDHVDHGYAVTVHKAQGSTVDRAHVLASEQGMGSREWAYVAGSRHRESLHIHADRATLAELAPAWSKSQQKDVSIDYQPMKPAVQRDQTMEISL